MKIALTLILIVGMSACANNSNSSNRHTIYNDDRGCDLNCQIIEDEIVRRDIEDRIIAEEIIADEIFEPIEY